MKKKTPRGQATIELVLIMVAFLAVAVLIRKKLIEENNFFVAFITTPWKQIGGMVESGNWGERGQVQKDHPTHFKRMFTKQGD